VPIYEYRRPDGTTFEVVQAFSDDPLTVDPDTGVPIERVLHPPAVHFKGTGFYNTDYGTRKRNRETAAAAEGSSSGKDSSSDASREAAGGASTDAAPAKQGDSGAADAKDTKTQKKEPGAERRSKPARGR
jgi:predicted nucleic acid-binding Zn ribbon protein